MGCKMLGIVNLMSKSPALIVGGMERKRKKAQWLLLIPAEWKHLTKTYFLNTVQNLLFHVS